jgi:hypothetical protein
MPNEEDEEKILMRREHHRHMKSIANATMRERHSGLKDVGYMLGKSKLEGQEDIVAVFLGYISGLEISRDRVYKSLASLIADSTDSLLVGIKNILRNKIRDERLIIKEMSKRNEGGPHATPDASP